MTSEYGQRIFLCKGYVSTAMPLCHWPCCCYPNHSLDQVGDVMNVIYPRWVGADGIMLITPVYWYQAPSPLKLMIDRLVRADGGNPAPTTTQGKDAAMAKQLELDGWSYPKHSSFQMNNRSLTGLNRYTTVEVSPCTRTEKLKRLQAGTS
ncbi:NAD(P)H-dependent oxidoreductase [Pseudomonas hormoni]